MALLLATYCSANKDPAPDRIPARQRYRSARIEAVCEQAAQADARAGILSGRFGLIAPAEPIPWYDHLLQEAEIPAMTQRVALTLRDWGVDEIHWITVDPAIDSNVLRYRTVMERAAAAAQATFSSRICTLQD